MTTLEDAWRWYNSTRRHLRLSHRLANRYWDVLPWSGQLELDDDFRHLDREQVKEEAEMSLSHLDDLAVVVLFSVFESVVRERIGNEVAAESALLRHRALKLAAAEAQDKIAEGSFFHVLQPFKDVHADLVEEVNQVRQYRNWVAHGKRGAPQARVTPKAAYDRLGRFLEVMQSGSP